MTEGIIKHRIKSFDILKFIAILLVLWGHAIQYFYPGEFYDNVVYRIIYSMHMPLFMMIVGFFGISLTKLPIYDFFVKKIRELLLPAFAVGFVISCFQFVISGGG